MTTEVDRYVSRFFRQLPCLYGKDKSTINQRNFKHRKLRSLYRVQIPKSSTLYDLDIGLVSRDQHTSWWDYYNHQTDTWVDCDIKIKVLKKAVRRHLDWHNKSPSCFISTFDNLEHARRWGMSWSRHNGFVAFDILEIDLRRLKSTKTWFKKAQTIVNRFDLQVPVRANLQGEYLVLRGISSIAIVKHWTEQPRIRPFTTDEGVEAFIFYEAVETAGVIKTRGVEDLDNIIADESKLQEGAQIVYEVHREEQESTLEQAASFRGYLCNRSYQKLADVWCVIWSFDQREETYRKSLRAQYT